MIPNKNIVWLQTEAFIQMLINVKQWLPCETGGVLIGYESKENVFVVTKIVGPGPKATHFPDRFIPDYDFHQNQISQIYRESNFTETYLGDWHSHPEDHAYLSNQDKKTLVKIANYPEARIDNPLMLILGTYPLEIKAWSYLKTYFRTDRFVKRKITFY